MNYREIEYSIIVAFCKNYGIGYKNRLPWHFKDDMKHFYNLTTSIPLHYDNTIFYKNNRELSHVIMGHNTWKSLDYKPLKNRTNIILTSNVDECKKNTLNKINQMNYMNIKFQQDKNNIFDENIYFKNILFFNSPYKIEDYLTTKENPHAWIIGGSSIYDFYLRTMNVKNIYSTLIHNNYNCDTYLNPLYINIKKTKYIKNKTDYIFDNKQNTLLEFQYLIKK